MPAILKRWVDRVFAYGKTYARGKLYEDGIGRGKRALVTITTGSGSGSYDGYGQNPSMTSIHHGVFWFNGFRSLPAFVAYRVAHVDDARRTQILDDYERYLRALDDLEPQVLPQLRDFDPETSTDRFGRWMLEVRSAHPLDRESIGDLQRAGTVVGYCRSKEDEGGTNAWVLIRAQSRDDAEAIARRLLLDKAGEFAIREAGSDASLSTTLP